MGRSKRVLWLGHKSVSQPASQSVCPTVRLPVWPPVVVVVVGATCVCDCLGSELSN